MVHGQQLLLSGMLMVGTKSLLLTYEENLENLIQTREKCQIFGVFLLK